jgi:hypothetical protein
MKALSELDRNDVIRAIAVVAVVTFPLMAYAQLGSAAKPIKQSAASSPPVVQSVASANVGDACANQHWPFFSAECLRGSTRKAQPRVVSINAEDSPAAAPAARVAATDQSRHIARLTEGAANTANKAPAVRPRKPVKPRVAHTRERRPSSVTYAANAPVATFPMMGW